MNCLRPYSVRNPYFSELARNLGYSDTNFERFQYINVPCGSCPMCRKERAREWKLRLVHESQYHELFQFVTLTYDDDHLSSSSLVKSDLQKFFKRLRKITGRSFKYFACGEYGPKTWRPHFHFIIFDFFSNDVYERCWSLGFVKVGNKCSDEAISYVAGYVDKKVMDKAKNYTSRGLTPPFLLCSQGLGLQWAIDNEKMLRQKGYVTYNGYPCPIPRYYRKKLGISVDWTYFVEFQNEVNLKMISLGYNPFDFDSRFEYLSKTRTSLEQKSVNLEAKKLLIKELL